MRKSPLFASAATVALAAVLLSAPLAPATAAPATGAVAPAAAPAPGENQLVSISNTTPPVPGDNVSDQPSISADGRYIAFASKASNLTSISPDRVRQVYLRDTVTGTTRLLSATRAGIAGDGPSSSPSISADGSLVAFVSQATNLYPASGSTSQVLLWSAITGTTEVVSVTNDSAPQMENGGAATAVLSADGKTVAWSSDSTNLTPEKTWGVLQVFVRDLVTRSTTLASRDNTVTPVAGSGWNAVSPTISGDGKAIAFITLAQLTATPNAHLGIYIRDRARDTLELASTNATGTAGLDHDAMNPTLSGSGRYLAFSSGASDAVVAPANNGGVQGVFVRDLQAGTTKAGSLDVTHSALAGGTSPTLSPDGTLLTFVSNDRHIVSDGASFPPGVAQVYKTELATGNSILISSEGSPTVAGAADSSNPVLSGDGTRVTYASLAANLSPVGDSSFSQVYVRDSRDPASVDRVGGTDRYEVSAAISLSQFKSGVTTVYVSSGEVFPDALSGSAIAGSQHAPILLVTRNSIPTAVATELTRLKPQRIVLVGGEATISAGVEAALTAYASNPVTRLAGSDRYAVSAAISRQYSPGAPVAYVASGAVYPDALSGSAAAGLQSGPVLLVGKDSIPASIAAELARLAPAKIVVLGGANTVSEGVVTALQATAPTSRIGGTDRFEVSANVSAAAFGAGTSTVYVASGMVFPDALSGSAAAIASRAPVLLVTSTSVPDSVAAELRRIKPRHIVVLGGPNTISEDVFNALKGYLAP
ncbi:cell wall-binding repeat-containing protein [Herbiconiux sp. 11R-BC]|uniref:cell wall-binding repeat-containing protein n=1 Tax=Herbiconiux sp. 11R-BC TaxID=3111637 RepID=UPI003BFEB478